MEYGRTKTEASISSFDVGSSARSTKQKDFRRKMADMARGSEGTTMPISEGIKKELVADKLEIVIEQEEKEKVLDMVDKKIMVKQ